MTLIENHAVVLFQGDSITDGGRNRDYGSDLGSGYANLATALFTSKYPQKQVSFLNRGISGDRIGNLQARWEEDCLDLKPTWVSIYVGINDTWRRYDGNDATSAQDFQANYRKLIVQTKEKLNANIVLIEPFVLPVNESQKAWEKIWIQKSKRFASWQMSSRRYMYRLTGYLHRRAPKPVPRIGHPMGSIHHQQAMR